MKKRNSMKVDRIKKQGSKFDEQLSDGSGDHTPTEEQMLNDYEEYKKELEELLLREKLQKGELDDICMESDKDLTVI